MKTKVCVLHAHKFDGIPLVRWLVFIAGPRALKDLECRRRRVELPAMLWEIVKHAGAGETLEVMEGHLLFAPQRCNSNGFGTAMAYTSKSSC